MKKIFTFFVTFLFISNSFQNYIVAQEVEFKEERDGTKLNLILSNHKIMYTVTIDGKNLFSDKVETQKAWSADFKNSVSGIETGGGFAFDVMYTDWRAPGKQNNADNPALLDKSFFEYTKYEIKNLDNDVKELIISFKGKDISLQAEAHYKLAASDFYIRKKITISDTANIGHFLRFVYPVYTTVESKFDLIKKGDFGQPIAITTGNGGAFFGIEYPGSTNKLVKSEDEKDLLKCGQEIGERIGNKSIESEWCVQAIVPDENVKNWFMKYVDDIRVAKLEPFTLYNSWYDLRSAEYPKTPKENVMNEENCLRIINLIRKNMIEKNDIKLDAFVLDDGWDVYKSDWVLRDKQFPKGFTPLVNELKKTNTSLGLWFGLTGGYSFRMDRVNWMKDHGYETVGKGKDNEMLCLAGKKYSSLFEKRVTDFVKNYNVGFYKWDGIQFSCSEPTHGHAIDIYSRRAIIESLLGKIKAVRDLNPNIYLNITSGTWLSPWWVKYSNQIWMDGGDYGYADVPSISPRDAAITYRDMVLHEDFTEKDLWFPISNLMTHGIIKGKLQMLGGEDEPLEKFTNESLIYFARGVSMWELYISPDILNDGEWTAISKSIHWARDRFPILKHTFMVGGSPQKGEPYGYVHFANDKGIIVARNPLIQKTELEIKLDPSFGFATDADSLVLERTYPTRWISPKLYSSNDKINFQLDGFETSVYEIYPLKKVKEPLLAGIKFDELMKGDKEKLLDVYEISSDAKLLNPSVVDSLVIADIKFNIDELTLPEINQREALQNKNVNVEKNEKNVSLTSDFNVDSSFTSSDVSILFKPSDEYIDKVLPNMKFYLNDNEINPQQNSQKGKWDWFTFGVNKGNNSVKIEILPGDKIKTWNGTAALWFLGNQKQKSYQIKIMSKNSLSNKILPPSPFSQGEVGKNILIGETNVNLTD